MENGEHGGDDYEGEIYAPKLSLEIDETVGATDRYNGTEGTDFYVKDEPPRFGSGHKWVQEWPPSPCSR